MADQTIGTARVDITADASSMQAAIETAKKSLSSMSAEAQSQYQRLSAAERRRIDSLIRQADTLSMTRGQQIAYTASQRANGPILDDITRRLKANEGAAQKAGIQFNAYGLSAKQVDAALRQVPAQMTDIIVSLQGGQKPLTVLLQQGGQLRDIFGGMRPAIEAIGGAFLRLINPVTVTVGAAIALAAAWHQGNTEMDEARKHLAMTGGALGVSVGQVSALASELDKLGGVTRGKAAAALTEIAKSGKIAGDQLALIGEVAVRSNQLLGKEVSKTVEEFEKLGEKPAEAAAELNQQYNFLTTAVYEQIKALEEQGRTQDAARLAQETYANVTNQRLSEVSENLGILESAWKGVMGMATGAWDAMLGIGRESTIDQQIRELEAQRSAALALGSFGGGPEFGAGASANVAAIDAQLNFLRGVAQTEQNIARARGLSADIQREGINAAAEQNKLIAEGAAMEDKRARAQEENLRRIEKIRRANPDSELVTPEAIAESIRIINEKFKDKQGKAFSNDAATKLLMTLREQEAALRAQIEGADKLTAQQQALAKFEQQIADIKTKQTLTAEEKSLLASESRLRAQYDINVAVEQEALKRKSQIEVEKQLAALRESQSLTQMQFMRDLDSFGKGDEVRRLNSDLEKIEDRYRRIISQREAAPGGLSADDLQRIRDSMETELDMVREYHVKKKEIQENWRLGAIDSLINYSNTAANVYRSMGDMAERAFKGMEDALVSFVRTGKADFASLADSIVADMVRIAIQQSITGPLAGMLGTAIGSMVAPSTAPAGVTPGVDWTFSGASGGYTGDGGKYSVAGIVHRGEYVLNQEATRRIGVSTLERMNRGYANGGLVGGGSTAAAPMQFEVNLTNTGGQQMGVQSASPRFDGEKLVLDVMLKDLRSNGPYARQLKGVMA